MKKRGYRIESWLERIPMIVQKEFLNKLKDFGLNSYEAKLWTALLSRGVSTAGELSDLANVPRSRSYDVLESLEKKGFIIMKLGKPIKYLAVPPGEVLDRVKKRVVDDAEKKSQLLENIRKSDILKELTTLHTQGIDMVDTTELTGAVKGRTNLYNHIESMVRGAKKSIVLMTTEEGIIRKNNHLGPALRDAKKRNVDIRIAAPLTKKSVKQIEEISSVGAIRHSNHTDSRFCVVDGREAAFMLLHDKETHPAYDVGVWVTSNFFASSLHAMFDHMWKDMKPADKI